MDPASAHTLCRQRWEHSCLPSTRILSPSRRPKVMPSLLSGWWTSWKTPVSSKTLMRPCLKPCRNMRNFWTCPTGRCSFAKGILPRDVTSSWAAKWASMQVATATPRGNRPQRWTKPSLKQHDECTRMKAMGRVVFMGMGAVVRALWIDWCTPWPHCFLRIINRKHVTKNPRAVRMNPTILMEHPRALRGFSTFSKVSDYGQCVKKCLGSLISACDWMVLRVLSIES